jgi:organic hydroperoxide reductase OsmC/OhrA
VRSHRYALELEWTGNTGSGTSGYRDYRRDHVISVEGKPPLTGSADRAFFGDPALHNPEDLLLAALSSCHALSYLALAARAGIVVTAYQDHADGTMEENGWGGGRFTQVVLHPQVTVARVEDVERATALHHDASKQCYVAASVNFPVEHEPTTAVVDLDTHAS